MRNELFKKIKWLAKEYYNHEDGVNPNNWMLETAESLLLGYLQNHPHDIEGWLLLATIETNPPLEDPYAITKYANKILAYDPHHPQAVLLIAWAHFILLGHINTDTYRKLFFAKSNSAELMSMIELAKAYHFEWTGDKQKQQESLECSVSYYNKNAVNLFELAKIYNAQGKSEEATQLYILGNENFERLQTLKANQQLDATNIEYILDYFR
jgi:hypothetical protein